MLPCSGCTLDTTNHILTVVLHHLTEFSFFGCTLQGDVNCSCTVDIVDLQEVGSRWHSPAGELYRRDDLNHNGTIDIGDVMVATGQWGASCPVGP